MARIVEDLPANGLHRTIVAWSITYFENFLANEPPILILIEHFHLTHGTMLRQIKS